MSQVSQKRPAVFSAFIAMLVTAVMLYIVGTGCASTTSNGAPAPTRIGPSGGTVTQGRCKLIIPAGALTSEVNFYIASYTANPAIVTGSAFTIGPNGTVFYKPAIINITYDAGTPGPEESEYQLGSYNNGQWVGIGDSTVETSLDYVTGETNSLSIYGIVTVGAKTVSSIEIINLTANSTRLAIGDTYLLSAVPSPDTGFLLNYTWSTTLPYVVSVNSSGLITSLSLGIATVNAYAAGKKSSPCTVYSGDLVVNSVRVSPSIESVFRGNTKQFSACAKNAAGQTLPGRTFTWFSGNDAVATVDANGLAYGVSAETCQIYASCEGVSGSAQLIVVKPPDWTITIADPGPFVGEHISMVLDGSNIPRISYYDYNGTNDDLKYASIESSLWRRQTADVSIDAVGAYTSIALYSNGNPGISYYDITNKRLKFVSFEASSWEVIVVESGNVGEYTSLKIDSGGNPRISYYDRNKGKLRYAYYNGSTWQKEYADWPFISADVGRYTSLALDASGNSRISYYDATNKNLKYAYKDGTGWHQQDVDTSGDVGSHTSLALDAGGDPRISYYDATNKDLKYAWKVGSVWYKQTVDSTGEVGEFTSLALDAAGNPMISYFDTTNNDLKFAWNDGTLWYTMTVDSTGEVGEYTSLKLNSLGKPRIAYYDGYDGYVKYAEGN